MGIKYESIIGIDPGSSGFICHYYNGEYTFYPIKMVKNEKGKSESDPKDQLRALLEIKKSLPEGVKTLVLFEDVHAIAGNSAQSMFSFGRTVGIQYGVTKLVFEDIHPVSPQKWMNHYKRELSITPTKLKDFQAAHADELPKSVKDSKLRSFYAVRQLFGQIDMTKSSRSKVMHDGKADAMLICHYGVKHF